VGLPESGDEHFAVAPLAIVALANPPQSRSFLVEFSVALGFVGLSMMGLQFGLVARFKAVAAPFGIDALTRCRLRRSARSSRRPAR
jgi:predicted ferric reductase